MKRDWTVARQKVDDQGRCRVCGITRGLQAAHIVPRSVGGGMEYDEIVPLCPPCHEGYDHHEIDLLPYLSHEEQAAAVRTLGMERARRRLLPSEYARSAA